MPGKPLTIFAAALLAGPLFTAQAQAQDGLGQPPIPTEQELRPTIPDVTLPVDLSVASIGAPNCVAVGETIGRRLDIMIENTGPGSVSQNFSIGVYLSPEPAIPGFNTLLDGGREFMNGIGGQSTKQVDVADVMSIPANYSTGPAYLGVIVDELDDVTETDENNNTLTVPIEIAASSQGCP